MRGATISIGRRDVVALVGRRAAASTLLNLAGFLDVPSTGERWLEGRRIDDAPDTLERIRRERIGFVFQQFNLIPVMSALENVEPAASHGARRAHAASAPARCSTRWDSPRANVIAPASCPAASSSGSLARARQEPAIVIADEPTASLDSTNARAVAELILDTNRTLGTAFLIASHDDRLCAHLPRRIEMRDGVPGVNRELVDVCVA